jgi:hypothetical protein
MRYHRYFWLLLIVLASLPGATRSQSWITSVSPAAYSAVAPTNANIVVSFSVSIAPQTLNNATVRVWAEQSGAHSATLTYDQGTRVLTIDPAAEFFPGERVDVALARSILGAGGDSLPGFSYSFMVRPTGGSGSFDPRSEYAVGVGAVNMLMHDFNRDGVVDLEYLDTNPSNNRIFFVDFHSNGWNVAASVYLAWPPVSMVAGDFDNDSQSDFAITKGNDALTIVERNQYGAYAEDMFVPVGYSASHIQVAELNGDGAQDLIVGRRGANSMEVLLNNGGGWFGGPSSGYAPASPSSAVPADMDLDGDMDILVAQSEIGTVRIYLNNGRGSFPDSLQVPVGGHPAALAAGDLDGDHLPDFVAADSIGGSITIVQNSGVAGFSTKGSLAVGGSGPLRVLLADFDSDGDLDIATMNRASKSISIFKNLGGMAFSRTAVIGLEYTPNDFSAVDWDLDGDLDLFAISDQINMFSILTNRAGVPRIYCGASSGDFGGTSVDTMTSRKFWVYNVGGTADLKVHVQHGPNPQFVVSPESLTIAPDDSASLTLGFTPTLCSSYADNFTLTHNDPLSGPLQIPLQGYGKVIKRTDPGAQKAWQSGTVPVTLTFAEPMDPVTISDATISIFGSRSGRHHTKNVAVSADKRSATFEIDGALITEETVTVTLSTAMRTTRGSTIVQPYSWSFKMRASQGTAHFAHPQLIADFSLPTGVLAGDLQQGDGRADLVVQNPQRLLVLKAIDTGWVAINVHDSLGSDARPVGGASLADVPGNGGVGILFGTWNESQTQRDARYMWWDPASSRQKIFGPMPDGANGSVTGDFDSDGDLDVLFSMLWQHSVQYFQNNGTWPFLSEAHQVNGGPTTLASADFDGDGISDVVASATGRDDIVFCRNMNWPFGTFLNVARVFVGQEPWPIAVADFNDDGRPDLAVGAYEANSISILLNRGNFEFQRVQIDVPGKPRNLVAADFNGDGNIDLAAAIEDAGKIMAWTNNGAGQFTKVLEEKVGAVAYGVEVVDNRRDGHANLIVTFDSHIAIMKNKPPAPEIEVLQSTVTFLNTRVGTTGTKSFFIRNPGTAPLLVSEMKGNNTAFSLSCSTLEVAAGDSQRVDINFTPTGPHATVDTIRILCNDVATPAMNVLVLGTGSPVESLTPAQNGKVRVTGDSIQIAFLEDVDAGSLGAGNIVLSSRWRAFDPNAFSSIASVSGRSLTYKGLPPFLPGENLAVTITSRVRIGSPAVPSSPLSWSFRAASMGGTGAFEEHSTWPGNDMISPTFLDIDKDGDLDAVYSDWDQTEAVILSNDGTGSFALKQRISLGKWCTSIASADFDGDGDQDIALSQQAYVNAITILNNDGTGNFTASQPVECPSDPGRIIAADYDNDGDADILFSANGCIQVLDNDGTGHFTLRQVSSPGALDLQAVADFDNDGFLDVCTMKIWPGELALYSYDGIGAYLRRCDFFVPGSCLQRATVGDFDGDGLCEIAVGGLDATWQTCIQVLKNHGSWDFPVESTVSISDYPYDLGVGDLDGDGDLDLATAGMDIANAKVTVALNDGTGHFKQKQVLDVGADPTGIDAGDFDNDGALDLMVNSRTGKVIQFLKNGFVLSVKGSDDMVPKEFSLEQNYPNPFNPSTTIRYELPRPSQVTLTVYDILGREVSVLVNERRDAGVHEVKFSAKGGSASGGDAAGLASGVYFYRLTAGSYVETKKLLLVR